MAISSDAAVQCASMCAIVMDDVLQAPSDADEELVEVWLHMVKSISRATQTKSTFNRRRGHIKRACWAYPRFDRFYDQFLVSSYSSTMFRKRLRVSRETFGYICGKVAPFLQRRDTHIRRAISLENRVSLAIQRLASGTGLEILADLYGCAKSTACKIVLDFCKAIKVSGLHDLYIRWPSISRMSHLAEGFEALRGIPYVIGAIDGSHIPIIAPKDNHADYYNRKGFHSILLQCTVAANCSIWDYDVGWAGSIHDSVNFTRSEIGKRCEAGQLGKYCLVGDCAYSPRPYMLVPFKGSKEGLSRLKYRWNFNQSSTRMPVERAFGMLKARFRILLKRCDMDLTNVPSMVVACLVLHNVCIVHGDAFDMEWINEAERDLQREVNEEESRSEDESRRAGGSCIIELHAVRPLTMEETIDRGQSGASECEDSIDSMLGTGPQRRDNLAKFMFKEYCKCIVNRVLGGNEREDGECDVDEDEEHGVNALDGYMEGVEDNS